MGCTESKIEYRRQDNHETHGEGQLVPLTKTFKVEKLAGDTQKPFCIYSFTINRTRAAATPETQSGSPKQKRKALKPVANATDDEEDKLAWRIKELVLDKALGEWLDKRKVEDRLYLTDMRASRLYTQFVIERPKYVKGGDPECCMKRTITVQVPRLVGAKYAHVDESYDIALKSIGEPIRDLRSAARDQVIQRAINFLLLADASKESSFAVLHSKQNVGRLFNLGNERHRRVVELGPCLRSCRGLATSIEPMDKSAAGVIALKLTEEMSYFFSPVSMIELIMAHFNFDVSAPLERDQIDALKRELINEVVEMRSGNTSNGEESLPEIHVAMIKDVSQQPNCEEPCDSVDEKSCRFMGQTTVEKQFKREFPHVKLRYRHMPCLISSTGRRMPLEMCWIKKGEMLKHRHPSREEKFDPDQLQRRTEIFEENCTELKSRYRSTLKKFGFQLHPAKSSNQKIFNRYRSRNKANKSQA